MRMHSGRGDFPFPDGENAAAHDTSLDRYPVWRIRSVIGIDMFDQARKTPIFDPLDITIRFIFRLNLINFNCEKISSQILRFYR